MSQFVWNEDYFNFPQVSLQGAGGVVVQCLFRGQLVVSVLVKGEAISLTLAELCGLL